MQQSKMKSGAVLYVLATLVVIGFPISSFIYWTSVARNEKLDSSNDSIDIPILSSLIVALILSVPIFSFTRFVVQKNHGLSIKGKFTLENKFTILIATVFFILPSIALMNLLFKDISYNTKLYEYAFFPHCFIIVLWLIAMASSIIPRR